MSSSSNTQESKISNKPCTEIGKIFTDAKIFNMTQATSQKDYDDCADQILNELCKDNGFKTIIIEEPPKVNNKMLAFYHPKNNGTLKSYKSEVWFDKNTPFYKRLEESGIPYPNEWFILLDLPDNPHGSYRLAGSCGGSVTVSGLDKIISRVKK